MNRREMLQCAAVLVSGASLSRLGFALNEKQMAYLATAPDYASGKASYLSAGQRRTIVAMAETIIPNNGTPGATDANTAHFIELMVQDWFNDQERAIFDAGLDEMQSRVQKEYGKPYDELTAQEQLEVLQAMEDAAQDHPWYQQGNIRRAFISDAPFICQVKELTVWGFFTSEQGVKEVLRFNPMPMKFDGHYPREEGNTTWAPVTFFR